MNIGKVIRTLRQERGETLEQVALEIGTDASNLSRIERGVQQPSNDLLVAIASTLETSITSIYALAEGIRKPGQLSATGLADEIDFSSEAAMLRLSGLAAARAPMLLAPSSTRLCISGRRESGLLLST